MRQLAKKSRFPRCSQELPVLLLVATLPVVVLMTALVIHFGPEPRPTLNNRDLWPEAAARAISEPSDRLLFALWTLVAVIVSVLAFRVSTRFKRPLTGNGCGVLRLALLLIWLIALSTLLVPSSSPDDDWRGLRIWALGVSAFLTVLVAVAYTIGGSLRSLVNVGAGTVGVIYLVAAGWQTSSSLRDAYHFSIVLDDVIRVGEGRLPYVDFLPTYASILGLPLVPIGQRDPSSLVDLSANFLLLLQVLSVLVVLLVVLLPARKSTYGVVGLATIGPIAFVQTGSGQSALQATPVIPGRVLLPLLGLLALLLVVRWLSVRGMTVRPLLAVLLGFVFGLGFLNNLEFGGAAAVAALVVLLAMRSTAVSTLKRAFGFLVGVATPLVTYALYGSIFESKDVVRSLILIPLTYASAGFDLHPISSLGPFVLVVMLAISSLTLGIFKLRQGGEGWRPTTIGVTLTFAGTWAALSMFYFTGRSFTSVLIAGQSIQVALILGSLTLTLPVATRALRLFGPTQVRLVGVALTALPLLVSVTLLIGGGRPQAILAYGLSGQPISASFPEVEAALSEVRASSAWRSDDDSMVGLVTKNSAIAASRYGVQDASTMLPAFMEGSQRLMDFQCQSMPSFRFLVIDSSIHDRMKGILSCREVLEQGSQLPPGQTASNRIIYVFPDVE